MQNTSLAFKLVRVTLSHGLSVRTDSAALPELKSKILPNFPPKKAQNVASKNKQNFNLEM
jgi:hypothetical protein